MKKFFTLVSLITFSASVLAANVCSQRDFVRRFPETSKLFNNCPGDTPQGYAAACADVNGDVHQFFCGKGGWKLLSAPNSQTYSDQNPSEVDLVEGDLIPVDDKEVLPLVN
jgi:hypothetical protein